MFIFIFVFIYILSIKLGCGLVICIKGRCCKTNFCQLFHDRSQVSRAQFFFCLKNMETLTILFFLSSHEITSTATPLTAEQQFNDLEEAKLFRAQVRAALSKRESGFNYCCYGNAGELTFADSRDTLWVVMFACAISVSWVFFLFYF